MTNSILIQNLNTHELENLISESLKTQLENFKKELSTKTEQEQLLTRSEVLDLLKINGSTLWHWQNKGRITAYKFGAKCYYKRSELLSNITPLSNYSNQ